MYCISQVQLYSIVWLSPIAACVAVITINLVLYLIDAKRNNKLVKTVLLIVTIPFIFWPHIIAGTPFIQRVATIQIVALMLAIASIWKLDSLHVFLWLSLAVILGIINIWAWG
jgi:hypothetical protein